ncbi:hypothetical protein Egran_03198 [Elaphomyces granulatus]|uniref:Postreplication repair E3 ubiquitin-protein ligase RAD18 n=1 Tax=Elaphomyces granulatus TaxID=519963 RepID=A0A232LY00_9EURO|nr:hypothetical protein Egran_03198 [Elaphomyces granulatus]
MSDCSFDIPNSTDWLETPLSLVSPLESSLRCQVCKDFFNNPVITSCSHTFCSLCIRRCLSTEGKCPVCRSSDQELKLRRNWAVQEIVDSFRNARPGMLSLAKHPVDGGKVRGDDNPDGPTPKKRRLNRGETSEESSPVESKMTRLQSRSLRRRAQVAPTEVIEDSEDEDFVPDDGLVACPICKKRMKNDVVFEHLDTCTGPERPSQTTPFSGSLQLRSESPRERPHDSAVTSPQRLPTINYSILKDSVLRKKLRDLGIPDWGPRTLLQRRHMEWMNLWNANSDAKVPKSKQDLLLELGIWERSQGGQAPAASLGGSNSVMHKEFDAAAWSTDHGDEFKRLIANARKRSDAIVRSTIPQSPKGQNELSISNDINAKVTEPNAGEYIETLRSATMGAEQLAYRAEERSGEESGRTEGSSQTQILNATVG